MTASILEPMAGDEVDPLDLLTLRTDDEHLESLMMRRLGNRVRDLRVVRRPNGLIIQGRTQTYYVKQLAQHAAMELGNRPILANDIEVS